MGDIDQNDIDKLLQDALVGGDEDAAAAPADNADRGPASQDDIDALFAAVGGDAPEDAPPPAGNDTADDTGGDLGEGLDGLDLDGIAGQDDIDALFSAVGAAEPETQSAPSPSPESAPANDLGGIADQDDIDALFSAVEEATAGSAANADGDETLPGPTSSKTDIGALLDSQLAEVDAQSKAEAEADGGGELEELLTAIADESAAMDREAPGDAAGDEAKDETVRVDTVDMDELLRQVSEAVPPPPPPPPPKPKAADDIPDIGADTAILDMNAPDISEALGRTASPAQPLSDTVIKPQAALPEPPAAPLPQPPPPAAPGARKEFSVLYGAGEVESVAGQISALISTMSEKAHGYMQAWIAADSEAKELRARALAEERRRVSLESEKAALGGELDDLRSRLAELEGAKVAADEGRRTLETTFQARIRELESQVNLLSSEAEGLKNELTRARNEATGVDIESRRNRFEVDRLKNEVESERMERLRIQRALENREKELQALQSQSAGQASSLFIDELHRLVRRLESELEARSSGAHEALKQLDRLDTSEDMVPVVSNLRAALMQAMGADDDAEDALKSLGREASGVRGAQALAPEKTEMVSFETALSTYNLDGALDVASALLREARATPAVLMRKIYQCPALRRSEVSAHLPELARLLEGLRTVQEAGDRSRGSETGESEVFYVQMFDFLHNLVRLKIVSRLTGDVWRLFLDLRGRFSFVTSDKQWAEYRDQTLNSKKPPA